MIHWAWLIPATMLGGIAGFLGGTALIRGSMGHYWDQYQHIKTEEELSAQRGQDYAILLRKFARGPDTKEPKS